MWADMVKVSLNGATQAVNWSAYACFCKQLTTRKERKLTSLENNFRENLILNILSYSLVRVSML